MFALAGMGGATVPWLVGLMSQQQEFAHGSVAASSGLCGDVWIDASMRELIFVMPASRVISYLREYFHVKVVNS